MSLIRFTAVGFSISNGQNLRTFILQRVRMLHQLPSTLLSHFHVKLQRLHPLRSPSLSTEILTMSMVLRKVWELVSSSTPSSSNSNPKSQELARSSFSSDLGAFEQLPSDILMQILRLLGPKEAAKLSIVCNALRSLVSDNRLWVFFLQTYQAEPSWDSVFFAETSLTSLP